jgi:hypothetical protein
MTKEVMHREAADNEYLHRDFHGALSVGIAYVDEHYGPEAVRAFLRRFTETFYAPLTDAIRRRGLIALKERIESVYATEGGTVDAQLSADELRVEVAACPAVAHMRANDYPVADLFFETSRTVYEALVDQTPFAMEWQDYDPVTGRSRFRFYRRPA